MLSIEQETKQTQGSNTKKYVAAVLCTASVATVAFVTVNSASSTSTANSALLKIPTDFHGEFEHKRGTDWVTQGGFHKYETEDGDWKVDMKAIFFTQGKDQESIQTYKVVDNKAYRSVTHRDGQQDNHCMEQVLIPNYGALPEALDNAQVIEDGEDVDPKLTYLTDRLCPEGSQRSVIHFLGGNWVLCGETDGEEKLFMRAFSQEFVTTIRSSKAMENQEYKLNSAQELLNCTRFDPKVPFFQKMRDEINGEISDRNLAVRSNEWPYADQIGTEQFQRSLGEYETDVATDNSYYNNASQDEKDSVNNGGLATHNTHLALQKQNNQNGQYGGNGKIFGNVYDLLDTIHGGELQKTGSDKGFDGAYAEGLIHAGKEGFKAFDEEMMGIEHRIDRLLINSGLSRPKPYNPPGMDQLRCFLQHGLGGMGNRNGSNLVKWVPGTGESGVRNTQHVWNVSQTDYTVPHSVLDRTIVRDASNLGIGKTTMGGSYSYWGGTPNGDPVTGAGVYRFLKACDVVNIFDGDTINRGYNNQYQMRDFCDAYLDGDDKLPGTQTPNPLHLAGYGHPSNYKVIFTHSMGGQYTAKAFATSVCQKEVPTPILTRWYPKANVRATSYNTSEPPMDGSNAAAISAWLCPRLHTVVKMAIAVIIKLVSYFSKALAAILKMISWCWPLVFGVTLAEWIFRKTKLHNLQDIRGKCYYITHKNNKNEYVFTNGGKDWAIDREAAQTIHRGVPMYAGQHIQVWHADERVCGTSPTGMGIGMSATMLPVIAFIAHLEGIWRSACFFGLEYPCQCSWRGCNWCGLCIEYWPTQWYNDGAVDMDSCYMVAEETNIVDMVINHADGQGVHGNGSSANQKIGDWYDTVTRDARDATMLDSGLVPNSWSNLKHSIGVAIRRIKIAVPIGDRDGSLKWATEQLAGGNNSGEPGVKDRNNDTTFNRVLPFDEFVNRFRAPASSVQMRGDPTRIAFAGGHDSQMAHQLAASTHLLNALVGPTVQPDASANPNSWMHPGWCGRPSCDGSDARGDGDLPIKGDPGRDFGEFIKPGRPIRGQYIFDDLMSNSVRFQASSMRGGNGNMRGIW